MSVAVVGLGSIGGVVAAFLQAAGRTSVVACTRKPTPTLTVEHADGSTLAQLQNLWNPALAAPVDWLLVCTKVQDTAGTAPWLTRLCANGTRVAVLQNGVDHAERLRPLVGEAPILPALVYFNGERLSPTSVRYRRTSTGDLLVPDGEDGEAFAALFAGTQLQIGLRDDFVTFAWRKFLTNIAVNPLTALTLQRQAVLRRPDVRGVCFCLLDEGVAVGRAAGANLGADDVAGAYETLMTFPPEAGTSMYFDRLAGRPLELEAMTGSLVAIGARLGIATPLNSALLALLRAISDQAIAV